MAVTIHLNLSAIDVSSIKDHVDRLEPSSVLYEPATGPSTSYTVTSPVRHVSIIRWENTEASFTRG